MPNDHDTGLVTASEDCAPCGLHEPTRVAYYDGKMLTARDLTAEQTYHIGMRHLSNMLLEGEGTVWIQSLPFSRLAARIIMSLPPIRSGGNS